MAKVVIFQPYLPAYRVSLFDALATRLREAGHEFLLITGRPTGAQRARRDEAHLRQGLQLSLPSWQRTVAGMQLRWIGGRRAWHDADVLVVELAAGSLDSWCALLSKAGRRVAVWGHVGDYVADQKRITSLLKRLQAQLADHVFAYTASGGRTAQSYGVPAKQVTVLRNTVDVEALRSEVRLARQIPTTEVRQRLDVGEGPVFATIGGLDDAKRIDLIAEVLDLLWIAKSRIQLVVGGSGAHAHLLQHAVDRGQVRMLGNVDDRGKALVARVAVALLNPGRVGLIAVESMAMAVPILTTTPFPHAPEFEYLRPGIDVVTVDPTANALATAMTHLVADPGRRRQLVDAIEARMDEYLLPDMVRRMFDGIIEMVDA